MMDGMNFSLESCPVCGQKLKVTPALKGKTVGCPSCAAEFITRGTPLSSGGAAPSSSLLPFDCNTSGGSVLRTEGSAQRNHSDQ